MNLCAIPKGPIPVALWLPVFILYGYLELFASKSVLDIRQCKYRHDAEWDSPDRLGTGRATFAWRATNTRPSAQGHGRGISHVCLATNQAWFLLEANPLF